MLGSPRYAGISEKHTAAADAGAAEDPDEADQDEQKDACGILERARDVRAFRGLHGSVGSVFCEASHESQVFRLLRGFVSSVALISEPSHPHVEDETEARERCDEG